MTTERWQALYVPSVLEGGYGRRDNLGANCAYEFVGHHQGARRTRLVRPKLFKYLCC